MRIDRPLLKLPIRFDAEALAREITALPDDAWMAHPQKFDGNVAVPLVSPGGAMTDEWAGPMAGTPHLGACPYTREIMGALGATWGRSRLMGLAPGSVVPEHVDIHYYWRTHLRLHIPVVTNPGVTFRCAGETVHMAAGECWLLDSFYRHSVENRGDALRVHLVLDTVGGGLIWDLLDRAVQGDGDDACLAPGSVGPRPLELEQINAPAVMSPWEMNAHLDYLLNWVGDEPRLPAIRRILDKFRMAWTGTWARYGTSDDGVPHYAQLLRETDAALAVACKPPVLMRNQWGLLVSIRRHIFANAISPAKLNSGAGSAGSPPIRISA